VGHRGASADAPENTLAAFRLAVAQGADGVELDVWRCRSGEVVVHHDVDTQRTAGARLRIPEATWRELRSLDVGGWKSARYRGERIPSLREALEAVPGAMVNVEMKSAGVPDLGLAGAVLRVLREARALDRCLVSSFDYALMGVFRLLAPTAPGGLLFADERGWSLRARLGTLLLRPAAVHPQASLVTADRLRAWREQRLDVNVWTVDDVAELERLAALGVSGIITNRPDVAVRVLRRSR